jgi:hypothetical protein
VALDKIARYIWVRKQMLHIIDLSTTIGCFQIIQGIELTLGHVVTLSVSGLTP